MRNSLCPSNLKITPAPLQEPHGASCYYAKENNKQQPRIIQKIHEVNLRKLNSSCVTSQESKQFILHRFQ